MPKGTAKITVMMLTMKVPIMAGKIPPSVMPIRGGWVRKFQERVPTPLIKISNNITPKKTGPKSPPDKALENQVFQSIAFSSFDLLILLQNNIRYQIHYKRHDKENEADHKQSIIMGGVIRNFS